MADKLKGTLGIVGFGVKVDLEKLRAAYAQATQAI